MEGEIARCGISLESQLDSQHIGICARRAIDFKLLSAELGINEAEEMSINVDNDNHESKKVSLLRFWIQKYGTEATYGRLFSAFDALNWRHVKQKCIADIKKRVSPHSNMTSQPLSVPTRPEYSPNEEGIDSDKEESPLEGNVNLQEAQASLNIISSADAMNRLSKQISELKETMSLVHEACRLQSPEATLLSDAVDRSPVSTEIATIPQISTAVINHEENATTLPLSFWKKFLKSIKWLFTPDPNQLTDSILSDL